MEDRLIEILSKEFYGQTKDECICVGCVFYYSTCDLFNMPSVLEMKKAEKEVRHTIEILNDLTKNDIIDNTIDPFLISIFVMENLEDKINLSLKFLRKNALILGYMHSFIQYLWYSQDIIKRHPDFKEERVNRVMFNTERINYVKPIEIGLETNKTGYACFIPKLYDDGKVDMEYKFIGKIEGFGMF